MFKLVSFIIVWLLIYILSRYAMPVGSEVPATTEKEPRAPLDPDVDLMDTNSAGEEGEEDEEELLKKANALLGSPTSLKEIASKTLNSRTGSVSALVSGLKIAANTLPGVPTSDITASDLPACIQ
jgi:hypothetical protein